MSLAAKLLTAAGGGVDKLYSDDVFSAYTYTGNGLTQTINNGIDLAGKGGMVWVKERAPTGSSHALFTTDLGGASFLTSNSTAASGTGGAEVSFGGAGFSLQNANGRVNTTDSTYVSWTFRKAPKFFDVVTYTGNGSTQTVNHALGVAPGMIITKSTSASGDWFAYHRGLPNPTNEALALNSTSATLTGLPGIWGVTSSAFTLASGYGNNVDGRTYVAYLFAHDPSADGIIQCGSFTTDSSGNAAVNHGWSAGVKFAAIKASSTTGDWEMYDTARTSAWSGSDARLRANLPNAEDSVSRLSASGTSVSFAGLTASATYVYLFIVAPT